MSANFTLTGTENLQKIFREFPEGGYRKPLNTAFRKAAAPVRAAMIRNLPSGLSSLSKVIKAKTSRPSRGEPSLAVGVFNDAKFVNRKGISWNPWVVALWSNYGTLDWRANRFHNFKSPVRNKIKSNNMRGIKPLLFIERAWDQSKAQAQTTFEEVADKEITKFFDERANKL